MVKKRITAQEAAKLLGVSAQAVRQLGKDGTLSYVDLVSPGGKPTRYYFKTEILQRKALCRETTSLAKDTEGILERAREMNLEAKKNEVLARARLKGSRDWTGIASRLLDILDGLFEAVYNENPRALNGREREVLKMIIDLKTVDEISDKLGVTYERTRQIAVKAARRLVRGKSFIEENEALKRENMSLKRELEEKTRFTMPEIPTVPEQSVLVLSEPAYNRRKVLLSDISVLWLSDEDMAMCAKHGIKTVGDFVSYMKEELELFDINAGAYEARLNTYGFTFGMDLIPFGIGNQTKLKVLALEKQIASASNLSPEDAAVKDKLLLRIYNVGLSVRSYNCLTIAGINTIADLVRFTPLELMKLRHFGAKSMSEIETLLEKMGLEFGMNTLRYGIVPRAIVKPKTKRY